MGEVTVLCGGIICGNQVVLDIPGWIGSNETESNYLFCPECELEYKWFRAQCPGCVGGFPDCGLAESFMYSRKRTITSEHLSAIRSGRCPYRVNGSMMFSQDAGLIDINLSDIAEAEQGKAVADSIIKYCLEYPAK